MSRQEQREEGGGLKRSVAMKTGRDEADDCMQETETTIVGDDHQLPTMATEMRSILDCC